MEVERLCDILERAAEALKGARKIKNDAQKELDEAAKAAKRKSIKQKVKLPPQSVENGDSTTLPKRQNSIEQTRKYEMQLKRNSAATANGISNGVNGNALGPLEQYYTSDENDSEDDDSDYTDNSEESDEETGSEFDSVGLSEEGEDDLPGFDMGSDALEQVRYRLETAKIDPNSPEGTTFLDELLLRLQNANVEVIDSYLVNEFIDELFETENGSSVEDLTFQKPHPQNPNQQHPVIRIHRGGKALGWYQGQLDARGYAREGDGSMYYDAGHECHGFWENDEMIGRGIYQWSDGHVYDGEWLNGKRHGLGRFIRPDNVILYGRYVKGHHKGQGVRYSADRKEAQLVVDGVPKKTVSLAVAKDIVSDLLGFGDALPPPA